MRTHRSITSLLISRGVIVALVAAWYADVASAEAPPYQSRILSAGAAVRSGPGDAFYITDSLAEGQMVEVYREEPNGWLAIRPPEESFSWIYGKNLEMLDGGLAKVNRDNVASKIGSRLSSKRNAVQIRLKKGEVVQIIDEDTIDDQTWYKIAPPSGEFRWIHVNSIRPASAGKSPRAVANAILTTPIADQTAGEEGGIRPTSESDASPRDNWRAASAPLADITAPPLASGAALPPTTASPLPTPNPTPGFATSTPPMAQAHPITSSPEGFSRQVADLDLRLSRMVAEPPVAWNIEALRQEAELLLPQAQTVQERNDVNVAIAKIDRFNTIRERHRQSAIAATTPVSGPTPPSAPILPPAPVATGYDAVGVLRPVVSKRPGAPQFALVDERGQVVSFVTATPDMNLQPYIGRRIGIAGNRGFIPEFRRAHVVASRVTPLADSTVR